MEKLIIFIIIILLLVGGSYYFFFAEKGVTPSTETDRTPSSALSASDESAVVEQELQATEITNLDKEFADIDTELNAALNETP